MDCFEKYFKRKEYKYILTKNQLNYFMNASKSFLLKDQYGKHTISSIYLDTDDFELIRKSLEKPEYKEKIRLRSYGPASKSTPVYLELKKKYKGITYKRRIQLTYQEAINYLTVRIKPEEKSQIFNEIDWVMSKKVSIKPRVVISYDRIAFIHKDNENIRVTFDFSVRWRDYNINLRSSSGQKIISPDICLMELKVTDSVPFELSRVLSEYKIYPSSFSKYGEIYTKHMFNKGGITNVG